jgi:hypothetical protein
MNTKIRFLILLVVCSILVASCGGAAATQAPAATEAPATQAPAVTEAQATEPPTATEIATGNNCSVTPDGLGQSFSGRESASVYLGDWHGTYVYDDILNQLSVDGFKQEFTAGKSYEGEIGLSEVSDQNSLTALTELIIILVADTYPKLGDNQNNVSTDVNSFIRRVDLYSDGNKQGILVVAVDTNGFNFDEISSNIPSVITYFSNNIIQLDKYILPAAKHIVVNMSFVFVPCNSVVLDTIKPVLQKINEADPSLGLDGIETMDQLGEKYGENGNFYKYVNCIEQYTGDKCRQPSGNLRNKLLEYYGREKYESDPVKTMVDNATFNAFVVDLAYDPDADKAWLTSLNGILDKLKYSNTEYVGAAGNFGYQQPFTPASWDYVIAVSSEKSVQNSHPDDQSVINGLSLAKYSNWGEVQLDGDYWNSPNTIYGTSFAAPKFSAKVAQHLLIDSNCPMGFNIAPANGPWNNQIYNCSP